MQVEIITTKDGSHSLYRRDLDEQYHSIYGAIQESMHIFIQNGFDSVSGKQIQVFEMGFGTGLNALLTFLAAEKQKRKVKYLSIEKYPLAPELALKLNYPKFLSAESFELFRRIHMSEWNSDIAFGQFIMRKIDASILDYLIPSGNDLVYFDAFSPDKEPELWSDAVFGKVYASMSKGGVLVTYSAKGEVRRRLQSTGFTVEKLTGPPGKKHILRAVK